MELSRHILKEFADVSRGVEREDKTQYLRGTIKSSGKAKYVRIDGSESLTPISEIVDVKDGDRVIVTIENHEATILGNLTMPPSAYKEQEAIDKAEDAQGTASEAISKAENAQGSAGEAVDKADMAQKLAQSAGNKADAALVDATNASASADQAKQDAAEAITAAENASANSTEAKQLATTAGQNAETARQEAALAQNAATAAQGEVTRIEGIVTDVKGDINTALEDVANQAAETEAIKETLRVEYAKKTEVSDVKAALTTEISKKVGELQTTVSQTYAAKNEVVEMEGRLQSQITQTAGEVTSVVGKVEQLESDTTEAQKKVDEALEKSAAAQVAANQAQANATASQAAADAAKANAATATQKATAAAQNAATAAATAAEADRKVAEAKTDLNEAKQNLANTINRVDATEAEIAEAQKKVDTAQAAVTQAQKDAAEATLAANNAHTAANQAQNDATEAQNAATNAQKKADNAAIAAGNAQAAANQAQKDVAALTKRVVSAETAITQNSEQIKLSATKTEEIGNKLDNLQVGGTNLIRNTSNQLQHIERSDWLSLAERGNTRNFNLADYLGKRLTLRVWIQNPSVNAQLQLYFDAPGWKAGNIVKAGQSGYSQLTVDVPETLPSYWNLVLGVGNGVAFRLDYKELKAEIGDFATSWSPAPEDQQSQIDGINNNIANNYYQKTTVDSKISTATSGITAQYTQDINTKLGNYYDKSTIDSKLTIDGQGIATYVKSTQSQLDNLQICGENLIRNTNTDKMSISWTMQTGGYERTYYKDNGVIVTKLKRDNVQQTGWSVICVSGIVLDKLKPNTKYIVSFEIQPTAAVSLQFALRRGNGADVASNMYSMNYSIAPNQWSKITFMLTTTNPLPNLLDQVIYITGMNSAPGVEYHFRNFKMAEGNKETPWSPAPEDMATLTQYTEVKQLADRISSTVYDSSTGLTTKVNQLAGKYAITALNSAGDILASLNLNANTSTAEINAKLIRLNGSTKMDDAFVNKLVANSIITNKIKSTEISGDIIKGGTIQGVTLKSTGSGAVPGEVEVNDGTIAMEKQEVGPSGRYFNRGFVSPLEMTMSKVGPVGGRIGLIRATSFTPFGFNNQALDTGNNVQNHRLFFHYQGLSIESDGANSGVGRNSGLKVFGEHAYIDLKPGILNDPGDDSDPIKMRIIATPNNTFEFRNNYGNIYMFTKGNENIVVNGYKIPYTWAESTAGIKYMRVIRPNESNPYIEISNHAGKLWGVNIWLSDQRLKSNITSPTKDALDTINQLQVRQFDWKSDNVHEDFGLIAQEIEQVLPNAVFKVGDYYQVKDSGLIPVLIGAVQKLSKKVNLLESIIYNTKGGNLL